MLGQEPPIHRRSTTAVRRPGSRQMPGQQLAALLRCQGPGCQAVLVETCFPPCAALTATNGLNSNPMPAARSGPPCALALLREALALRRASSWFVLVHSLIGRWPAQLWTRGAGFSARTRRMARPAREFSPSLRSAPDVCLCAADSPSEEVRIRARPGRGHRQGSCWVSLSHDLFWMLRARRRGVRQGARTHAHGVPAPRGARNSILEQGVQLVIRLHTDGRLRARMRESQLSRSTALSRSLSRQPNAW